MATKLTGEDQRAYWQRQVALWRSSGQSAPVYCREAGLCEKQFRAWYHRLRREAAKGLSGERPTLIPVEVRASTPTPAATPTAGSGITLRLACGVGIDVAVGFDAPTLQAVVQALESGDVLA